MISREDNYEGVSKGNPLEDWGNLPEKSAEERAC